MSRLDLTLNAFSVIVMSEMWILQRTSVGNWLISAGNAHHWAARKNRCLKTPQHKNTLATGYQTWYLYKKKSLKPLGYTTLKYITSIRN